MIAAISRNAWLTLWGSFTKCRILDPKISNEKLEATRVQMLSQTRKLYYPSIFGSKFLKLGCFIFQAQMFDYVEIVPSDPIESKVPTCHLFRA